MHDGEEPLYDLEGREGAAAIMQALKIKELSILKSDFLGDFVAKARRGEYGDAQALYEEVQMWLEDKGYIVEGGCITGMELTWLQWC